MSRYLKLVKLSLSIATVSYFIVYFKTNNNELQEVLNIPYSTLMFIVLLDTSAIILNGIFLKRIIKTFSKNLCLYDSFFLSILSAMGNYFLPMGGGAIIRSVYLNRNLNISYSHFVSMFYGNYVVVYFVNSLLALVALIFLHLEYDLVSYPMYMGFGMLFIAMCLLSICRFPSLRQYVTESKSIDKVLEAIRNILIGWNQYIMRKELLRDLILLTLLNFFIMTLMIMIEFEALNININYLNIILYNALVGVSLLISITPGALGVREYLIYICSDVLGITRFEIMQLALLDRSVLFFTIISWFLMLGSFRFLKYGTVNFMEAYGMSRRNGTVEVNKE